MGLVQLFVEQLLPVFLVAGTGYLLSATLRPDPATLSRIAFFALAPCLVFRVIVESDLSAQAVLRMAGFAMVCLLGVAGATAVLGRILNWPRPTIAAMTLVVLLPNAGNYGLPASLLSFGEAGLGQASVFFVTSAILTFTVGVFVASAGRAGVGAALGGLVRVPALWAVVLALILVQSGQSLPRPVERSVYLLADASIPTFLLVLGMQLHRAGWKLPAPPVLIASGMRLVVGAAAGLALASPLGLEGVARQAAVLQSAMPSAVICIVLATEYDVEPEAVTAVVFLSTLLSPLTLTPLLAYLGGVG